MALRTGRVIIAKNIKLDKSYKDVLDYTESEMLTLVTTNKVDEVSSASFVKVGENQIDTPFSYADALKCNYMAFQNPSHANKWFFCFIDHAEYINNGTTRIHFIVDVYSTWNDYWQVNNCFVIREHVSNDTVGANTVPESLELGEYKILSRFKDSNMWPLKLVIASTLDPSDDSITSIGGTYGGIYSGVRYFTYDDSNMTNGIQNMVDDKKGDAISCVFLAPNFVLPQTGGGSVTDSNQPQFYTNTIDPITALDGYVPKNNKLLTWPFCYILASNSTGMATTYRQEFFELVNNKIVFTVYGCLTPGCSIRMLPNNYNGYHLNLDAGITLGKFPQCNWATDMFTNWATQQGVNVGIQAATAVKDLGVGLATDNPALVIKGGITAAQAVNQVYQASLIPPQTRGNINSGDITTSMGENTFSIYRMSIREEYARICDDYFTKYGYKINRIKTPSFNSRTYWNFIQIGADENIGYSTLSNKSVPASDMEIINNIFRQGVTIWHNHANLGNYSLNNTIVS